MNPLHTRLCAHMAMLSCGGMLCACASTTPHWDQHFGDASRIALAQQVLNPDAARNAGPLTGLDGRSAAAAYDRYQKSFGGAEARPSLLNTDIGGK